MIKVYDFMVKYVKFWDTPCLETVRFVLIVDRE